MFHHPTDSNKENTSHAHPAVHSSSDDEAPLSAAVSNSRRQKKKVKIDRNVRTRRVKRSHDDSGSSEEETTHTAQLSDEETNHYNESSAPKYGK